MIPLALAKKMAQKLFGWSIRAKGFFQWVHQTSEHFNVYEFLHNGKIIHVSMDYRHSVRKSPSLHGRKSNPNSKFLGMAEANFVCHIGPNFQISLIYAFTGCP